MSNYAGKFDLNSINNPWNKAFDLIKSNAVVLDVGCSSGNFGEALIEHKSCIVDGVEPDEGDANLAKHKLRTVYHGFVEDAFSDILKERKYDYIVFLDVIEHLFDPVNTLNNLQSCLNPGGGIIFSIPNMGHISVRLELLKGDFQYGNTGLLDNTHLHFYTKREIERVFKKAGYKIDKLDFTEAFYPKELIEKEIKKIGILKTSPIFTSMLTQSDAYIFQYVGLAIIGAGNAENRPHYFPNPQKVTIGWYEKREKDFIKIINDQNKLIKNLTKENKAKNKMITEINKILNDQEELARRVRISKYLKSYVSSKLNSK